MTSKKPNPMVSCAVFFLNENPYRLLNIITPWKNRNSLL